MDVAPQLLNRERVEKIDGRASRLAARRASSEDPDEPRFAIEEIIGFAVLVVCFGVVLSALHPSLLVRNTTANGGDMGAHVWWPAFLRDHWFNHFRLAGWSHAFFVLVVLIGVFQIMRGRKPAG